MCTCSLKRNSALNNSANLIIAADKRSVARAYLSHATDEPRTRQPERKRDKMRRDSSAVGAVAFTRQTSNNCILKRTSSANKGKLLRQGGKTAVRETRSTCYFSSESSPRRAYRAQAMVRMCENGRESAARNVHSPGDGQKQGAENVECVDGLRGEWREEVGTIDTIASDNECDDRAANKRSGAHLLPDTEYR